MVNLSIGYDLSSLTDPAGMCVLYTDENKVSHIQNLILGDKAELIYRLLTTPVTDYILLQQDGDVEIRFRK